MIVAQCNTRFWQKCRHDPGLGRDMMKPGLSSMQTGRELVYLTAAVSMAMYQPAVFLLSSSSHIDYPITPQSIGYLPKIRHYVGDSNSVPCSCVWPSHGPTTGVHEHPPPLVGGWPNRSVCQVCFSGQSAGLGVKLTPVSDTKTPSG